MPVNHLYDTWFRAVRKLLPEERITRVRNLVWLIVGMYLSQSVHLSRIAARLPLRVTLPATVQRLSRFLQSAAFRPRLWYRSLAEGLLAAAARCGPVRLIVDGSKIGARHQLLIVTLAYRKRALPIAWTWVRGPRGHSDGNKQLALLRYVQALLPEKAEVLLTGDSEFGSVPVLRQLERWHWHYVLRQKGSLLVCVTQDFHWQRLDQLLTHKGQVFWYPRALLTQEHLFHTRLLAYWKPGEDEPWFLTTNLPGQDTTLRAYKRRMWIEEMFGDWQGHGVDVEKTRLGHFQRLSRLIFAIALLYLWLVTRGSQTIREGLRRLVDRKDRRDLSIFRIGLYFTQRFCSYESAPTVRLIPCL